MSRTSTHSANSTVRLIGLFTILAGAILIIAGGLTWTAVTSQLKAESITVAPVTADDPGRLAGDAVDGPFTAFAEANAIKHHALTGADGRTYAQLGDDIKAAKVTLTAAGMPAADQAKDAGVIKLTAARTSAMNGSFLRSALFASVISYGIAALAIGLGILFAVLGIALRLLSPGDPVTAAGTPAVDSRRSSGASV